MEIKKLFKKIVLENVEGMNKEEALDWMREAFPYAGNVPQLIYTADTEEIGRKYYEELVEVIHQSYGECILYDLIKDYTSLVWSAWELIVVNNEDFQEEIIEKIKEE